MTELHNLTGPAKYNDEGRPLYCKDDKYITSWCPGLQGQRKERQQKLLDAGILAVLPAIPSPEQCEEHGLTVEFTDGCMRVLDDNREYHNPLGPAFFSFSTNVSYFSLNGNDYARYTHGTGKAVLWVDGGWKKYLPSASIASLVEYLNNQGFQLTEDMFLNLAGVKANNEEWDAVLTPYDSKAEYIGIYATVPTPAPEFIATTERERLLQPGLGFYKPSDLVIHEPKWVDNLPKLSEHAIAALQGLV